MADRPIPARSEVPEESTWNLKDVFESDEAWQAEYEALKAVPDSFREGSFGLGAGRLRTVFRIVLPAAVPGILSGIILSIGRIVGESAILMFTAGMSMFMQNYGSSVTEFFKNLFDSSGATLTVALYVYAKERADFDQAFAVAVVLLVIAFIINISAKLAGRKLKKH